MSKSSLFGSPPPSDEKETKENDQNVTQQDVLDIIEHFGVDLSGVSKELKSEGINEELLKSNITKKLKEPEIQKALKTIFNILGFRELLKAKKQGVTFLLQQATILKMKSQAFQDMVDEKGPAQEKNWIKIVLKLLSIKRTPKNEDAFTNNTRTFITAIQKHNSSPNNPGIMQYLGIIGPRECTSDEYMDERREFFFSTIDSTNKTPLDLFYDQQFSENSECLAKIRAGAFHLAGQINKKEIEKNEKRQETSTVDCVPGCRPSTSCLIC